jgi:tetratricopeptide (TPR) repeat protein
MRFVIIAGIGLVAVSVGTSLWVPAEEPAPENAPYKHLLTGEDARRAAELEQKALLLMFAGNFAEAQEPARELVVIRTRVQGATHWQTQDAERLLETLTRLAGLPAQQQADYASAIKAYVEARQLAAVGRHAEAQPLYEKALAISCSVLGKEHPRTLNTYNSLALNLNAQAKYTEAQPLHEKVLAICGKALGQDHPETATGYNNLATNLDDQGKYAEAQPLLEKALAIRRRVLGEDDASTATTYNNLAYNFVVQGRYAEAQPLYEKALAIDRRALGEDHPRTADSYNNLAENLNELGNYAEAQSLLERALAIRRKVQGEGDRATAIAYNNLAGNLNDQRKYTDAQPLYEKALAIWRHALGDKHPDTARGYNNLAFNLDAQGNFAEAQPLFEKALAISGQALGERHPLTASTSKNLAYNLAAQGKHPAAQALYEEALAICLGVLGENHPDTADSYNNLSAVLSARGQYAEAEKAAAQAARGYEAARLLVGFAGLDRARFATKRSPLPRLAALLARNGKPAAAWDQLQSNLARALLDEIAARHTWALTPDDRRQQDQLVGRIHLLDQQIAALLGSREPGDAARQQAAKLQEERAQAHAQLGTLATALAKKYHPVEGQVYDRQRIQQRLPDDAALVAWIDLTDFPDTADPAGDHWACVLRSRGEPVWVKLSGSGSKGAWTEEDLHLGDKVRRLLAARPEDAAAPWEKTVGQFYRQRLAPLAEHLGTTRELPAARHLVVLPSDAVAGIPVEALVAARADKQPAYTLSYAPSGTLFAWLQEQRPEAQLREARLLAVADPTFTTPDRPKDPPAPPDHGVLITLVQPESNAARAGLHRDDVLLSYAGAKLASLEELTAAIRKNSTDAQPGAALPVVAWRSGETLELKVAPGPLGVGLSKQPAAEAIRATRDADALLARCRGDAFQSLPGTRREAEAIAKLFPAADTLLGPDASEARLDRLAAEGKLKDYRYFHLATHGVANTQQPLLSYVALSQDHLPDPLQQVLAGKPAYTGRLTAEHILRDWKLDAELVTLSACQTGLGKYERGEGYLGFAQGLLLAGARSLVLSEWSVDDDATALLMTRFYQNLLGKRAGLEKPMAKADALREAKDWLRNLSADGVKDGLAALPPKVRGQPVTKTAPPVAPKPYAHPYYWAGFILIGDPN